MDSHTSSEYSDWTADAGINLQPSTPLSSRKRVRRQLSSSEEEDEENEEEEEKQQQSDEEENPGKKSKEKAKKAKNKLPRVSRYVLVCPTLLVRILNLLCHCLNLHWVVIAQTLL